MENQMLYKYALLVLLAVSHSVTGQAKLQPSASHGAISEEESNLSTKDFREKGFIQRSTATDNLYTVEKVKKITKSYSVGTKEKLNIDNQFGKVQVNTWSKNEVKVDIEIKAFEENDSKAQALLNGVVIDEKRSGELISFKTNISNPEPSGRQDGNEIRKGVSIDYIIYMPDRNALSITNKFGNIQLPDLSGVVNIKNSYGSVVAGKLSNSLNSINVNYGSVNIVLGMGSINISYGNLKMSHAKQINATVEFGSTKIEKLTGGGKIDNKYGSLKIDELQSEFKNLIILVDKGSVSMGITPASNFNFDVTVNKGGFKYPEDRVEITSQTPENERGPTFTKSYKGRYGKKSTSLIYIKSNLGSVQFL